jgi:nucleoside-diphosphate kinase
MEKTFLMIKPDGVQRGLVGEIVQRFERKGFQLVAAKFLLVSNEQAAVHYAEHHGKPFYDNLIRFITSSPCFAMVWQADQVIELSRAMIGKTSAIDALPGTIRADYAIHTNMNLIHGSDSVESANREIPNFFKPHEMVTYDQVASKWI